MNPQKDAGIHIQGEIFEAHTENVELHKKMPEEDARHRKALHQL